MVGQYSQRTTCGGHLSEISSFYNPAGKYFDGDEIVHQCHCDKSWWQVKIMMIAIHNDDADYDDDDDDDNDNDDYNDDEDGDDSDDDVYDDDGDDDLQGSVEVGRVSPEASAWPTTSWTYIGGAACDKN